MNACIDWTAAPFTHDEVSGKPCLQKDTGLFSPLIHHCGAAVDGALLQQNRITAGQLIITSQ